MALRACSVAQRALHSGELQNGPAQLPQNHHWVHNPRRLSLSFAEATSSDPGRKNPHVLELCRVQCTPSGPALPCAPPWALCLQRCAGIAAEKPPDPAVLIRGRMQTLWCWNGNIYFRVPYYKVRFPCQAFGRAGAGLRALQIQTLFESCLY